MDPLQNLPFHIGGLGTSRITFNRNAYSPRHVLSRIVPRMKNVLGRASRLLAFGLTVIASLPAHPIVASYERFYSTASDSAGIVAGGVLLLNELNCVACHAPP